MPEDELLAAELALGVLAGAQREAAERRIAREPGFARLVAAWEERLAPWAAEIDEIAAPPAVWDRIAATLPAGSQSAGWWQSLAFWRGLSLATGALAAACIGALIYLGNAPQKAPLIAALDGGGHRHFVATIDTRSGSIAVQPAAFSADATREPELWLIPADGKPRPLGMLRADRAVSITIPADLAALTVSNAVLAVSLEPPGGSPTGQPTGPVIATGKLTSL
ncbi:MAG TPA: anti-sigma factor [Pseudolabrys sp.]|nr:anti-sigma factor [Pseudolabrys sp.]